MMGLSIPGNMTTPVFTPVDQSVTTYSPVQSIFTGTSNKKIITFATRTFVVTTASKQAVVSYATIQFITSTTTNL